MKKQEKREKQKIWPAHRLSSPSKKIENHDLSQYPLAIARKGSWDVAINKIKRSRPCRGLRHHWPGEQLRWRRERGPGQVHSRFHQRSNRPSLHQALQQSWAYRGRGCGPYGPCRCDLDPLISHWRWPCCPWQPLQRWRAWAETSGYEGVSRWPRHFRSYKNLRNALCEWLGRGSSGGVGGIVDNLDLKDG